MKTLLLALILVSCSSQKQIAGLNPPPVKAQKVKKNYTDIKIMVFVIFSVCWWANDVGFNSHVK